MSHAQLFTQALLSTGELYLVGRPWRVQLIGVFAYRFMLEEFVGLLCMTVYMHIKYVLSVVHTDNPNF